MHGFVSVPIFDNERHKGRSHFIGNAPIDFDFLLGGGSIRYKNYIRELLGVKPVERADAEIAIGLKESLTCVGLTEGLSKRGLPRTGKPTKKDQSFHSCSLL
jgi:hypothetical protein